MSQIGRATTPAATAGGSWHGESPPWPLPGLAGWVLLLLTGLCWGHAGAADLLVEARAIAARAASYSGIWPDFWPPEQAFVLYQGRGPCVMYSPTQTPDGFAPMNGASGFWRGRCQGTRFQGPMLLFEEVGGVPVVGLRILKDSWSGNKLRTYLLHEAFHGYQRGRFAEGDREHVLGVDLALDERLLASKFREAWLLFNAAGREDRQGQVLLARTVLALRAARLAAMPPSAEAIEDGFMRIEGTATFVELRAEGLVAGAAAGKRLAHDWASSRLEKVMPWELLLRWQSYQTGAAIALLLDAWQVPDWRSRVAAGETLFGLLSEASDYRDTDAEALRASTAGLGDSEFRPMVRKMLRNADLIQKFERRYRKAAQQTLAVELPAGLPANFVASEMISTAEYDLVMNPNPLVASGKELEMKVVGRPVRLKHSRELRHAGGRVDVALSAAPEVLDCEPDTGAHCPAGTRVKARGVQVLLKWPARVHREGRTTWIRIEAASADDPRQDADSSEEDIGGGD